MRKVAISLAGPAEWALARFAGRQRAAAMLGDLLEQRVQKSAWWFWRSYSGMLIAVAWRPVLGFVGAFYVANWALNGMAHRQFGMWETPDLVAVTFLGYTAWFVALYAGVRYGLRDASAQLAAALAIVSTTVMFFLRYPAATWIGLALALCLLIASFILSGRRRAAMVFSATAVVFVVAYYAAAFLEHFYQLRILHLRTLGSREWEEHPSLGYVLYIAMLLGQVATACVCAWMHRRLAQKAGTAIAD